jgi:hypothetical protein
VEEGTPNLYDLVYGDNPADNYNGQALSGRDHPTDYQIN